jgi:hypothetical protein
LEYIERRLFRDGKPINSTVSLINQDFRLAGEVIAMSILQGGPSPWFFNANVYRYLTKQQPSTEDLKMYKEVVDKVC